MKLTRKYLRKFIKEELKRELGAETEGPSGKFYEFVKELVKKGETDQAIHDAVQGTEHADDVSSEDVKAAIAKARG